MNDIVSNTVDVHRALSFVSATSALKRLEAVRKVSNVVDVHCDLSFVSAPSALMRLEVVG
jgi:putative alpha-1,2-mannosidase